jgi:hypothetical protein
MLHSKPTWRFGFHSHGNLLGLLLHMFLHGGWAHLLSNMWLLWLVGFKIEDLWGRWVFVGLYLSGGIVAAVLHTPITGIDAPLVGASGAIAALPNNQPSLDKTKRMNNEMGLIKNYTVGAGLVPAPAPTQKQTAMDDEMRLVANRTPGAPTRGAPTEHKNTSIANDTLTINQKRSSLGDVVGIFKSLSTHAYVMGIREHGWVPFEKRLWHRNYYERIIRSDDALTKARAYTEANPQNWETDHENPNKQNAKVNP